MKKPEAKFDRIVMPAISQSMMERILFTFISERRYMPKNMFMNLCKLLLRSKQFDWLADLVINVIDGFMFIVDDNE